MADNKTLNLPLLITRGLIVFPNITESIEAGRTFSMNAISESRDQTNSLILITAQKDPKNNDLTGDGDIYDVATLCRIVNFVEQEKFYRIRVVGSKRVKLDQVRYENDSYWAEATVIEDEIGDENEEVKLIQNIVKAFEDSPNLGRNIPKAALNNLARGVAGNDISDTLAAYLPISVEQKASILREPKVNERLRLMLQMVAQQKEIATIDEKIEDTVRERAEKTQKEYYLRERMKAIKDELGESGGGNDIDAIKEKLEKNPYPESVKKKVNKEIKKFEMMPESSIEASLILNYLDTIMNVPWYQETEDNDDLNNVRKILDEDHYGLEKVKERIIEYLAVKHETHSLKAPILCFYGPPGCGKTSLGKSIARALNRKFIKSALGGVNDEAEIRGHRRTYVGSMPGRIISGMTKAGTINPVFLLDEIDKVGGMSSNRGDPSSALLEVLDPEQNNIFNDNYLEEPYDLSKVLFIATANNLQNIPGPLRDRLELIEVPSYTEIEKIKIAEGFLIKKQMEANGLKPESATFTEDGIKEIIECYTREAGVRSLERLIASCCRKAVVQLLTDKDTKTPIVIDAKKVQEYLGVEIFEDSKKEKEPQVGIVTGLAYTDFGGDILPIEVNHFPGKGGFVITGQLGDVMKESCAIALDYVKANHEKYGIDSAIFEKNDLHIHAPEGAIPKDGPSAGVAITLAIISSLTGRKIDNNVAMTGEVTLRGLALPIGGLREKSLAALRSGIKTIIVPEANKKDVNELPKEVKDELKIVYMKCVDDAVAVALLPKEG